MNRLAIFVLFLSVVAFAKERSWQTGELDGIVSATADNGVAAVPIGSSLYLANMRRTDLFYKVRSNGVGYTLWRSNQKQLNVTIHSKVKVAFDGENAYMLDDEGKEAKLKIVRKVALNQ